MASQPTTKVTMRWSDIAANRKSTHPDAAPIKPILDTVELYEALLSHLPCKDLSMAQRVCRQIRAVVQSSLGLKKKLFLIADSDATDSPRLCNPLVISKMGPPGIRHDSWVTQDTAYRIHLDTRFNVPQLPPTMFLSRPPVKAVDIRIEGRKYKDFYPGDDRRGLPTWDYGTIDTLQFRDSEGVKYFNVVDAVRRRLRNARDDRSVSGIGFPGVAMVIYLQKAYDKTKDANLVDVQW